MLPDRGMGKGLGGGGTAEALKSNRIATDQTLDSMVRPPTISGSAAVEHVRDRFCVVVEPSAGHFRTRIFMTLAAAEKAAERAVAAGHDVTVILSRIDPVSVVVPGRRWSA